MKLKFHAKSCTRGFYHHLIRNAIEGSKKTNLIIAEKFVL